MLQEVQNSKQRLPLCFRHGSATCGGENPADDATKPDEKLPERHVLLRDFHHERTDIIFHKDP